MTEDEMAGWHHWLDGRVWVNSGSWWWTGRPGVLQFMGSQRVRHDWAMDLIWSDLTGMFYRDLNSGSRVYMYVKIHQAVQLKYVSLLTVVYMIRSAFSELCSPLGFVLNWWWIPVLAKNPAKLVWESPHHWYLIKLLILLFPDPWYLVKFIEVFFH